jgi:hypothetical protein
MGKVNRDGETAVKRNRVIAGKITISDPFSSPVTRPAIPRARFPKFRDDSQRFLPGEPRTVSDASDRPSSSVRNLPVVW